MIYIGIDVHKKRCVACLQDETGQVLNELKFLNKQSGFQELLALLEGKKAKAVMESTGNLWIRLYRELEAQGVGVVLSNPAKTRVIAESVIQTDDISSRMLTDLLRAGLIAVCYVPSPEVREMRSHLRYRTKIVRDLTRIKNRIHSLLDMYELPEFEGTDLFGKAGLKWLREQLPALTFNDRLILRRELIRVEEHTIHIKEVELEIAAQAGITEDVKLLMSLIGVGYFTALLFLYEIGNIKRFSSSSKLASWIGLVPKVHQSGNSCYYGNITKKGSSLLRWSLIQAAHSAVRSDPHWRAKFNRISAKRGKQKAYVAIARELAVTMYHMLTRREPYWFGREKTYTQKLKNLERLVRKTQTNQGEAPV
jgi:transposase